MGGKSKSTTTIDHTTGPEQWMKDEGQKLYRSAEESTQGYEGYGGERVAGYGENWDKAEGLIQGMAGQSNADFGAARSLLQSLMGAPGNDPNKSVSDYINPHVAGVLAPTLRNLDEARQRAGITTGFSATASGAFGDAQHGVATSLGNRDYMNSVSDATSRAYSDAFDKGLAQQNTVLARLMQMPGLFQSLGTAEDGRTIQTASALNTLGKEEQVLNQARNNVGYADFVEKRDYDARRSAMLMELLNATPHDVRKHGTTVEEKPDNSGIQALTSLGTKAVGAFAPTLLGALL